MDIIKLPSTDSNFVSSTNKHMNFSNSKFLLIRNNIYQDKVYETLLRFSDLSSLPSNIKIKKATLYLFKNPKQSMIDNCIHRNYLVYKNIEYYINSSVTWLTKPRNIQLPMTHSDIHYDYLSETLTINLTDTIKEWYITPTSNFGITLGCEPTIATTPSIFDSSKNRNSPYLIIEYTKNDCDNICNKIKNVFDESHYYLNDTTNELYTPKVDISHNNNVTFFVQNLSFSKIKANIQISPNGINFVNEHEIICLQPNEINRLVVAVFSKYARVRIISESDSSELKVNVWYQGQTLNFIVT